MTTQMLDGLTGFIVAIARVAITDGDDLLLNKVAACAAGQNIENISMLDSADIRKITATTLNASTRIQIRRHPFFDFEPVTLARIVSELREVEKADDYLFIEGETAIAKHFGDCVPPLLAWKESLIVATPNGRDGEFRVEQVSNVLQLRGLAPNGFQKDVDDVAIN